MLLYFLPAIVLCGVFGVFISIEFALTGTGSLLSKWKRALVARTRFAILEPVPLGKLQTSVTRCQCPDVIES